VNQPNAIVINIAPHAASAAATSRTVSLMSPNDGASAQGDHVAVMVRFATLAVRGGMAGMDMGATPGQFIAPLLPTRLGQITIRLSGKIGTSDIKTVDVQPEEVQSTDVVAFPKLAMTTGAGLGTAGWLGAGGLVFGTQRVGTLLGAVALMRRK
jgi:hypothetical protein